MNDPREIMKRIERRRRHLPGSDAPRTPAPTPVAPAPVPQNPTAPPSPAIPQNPPAQPVPRPVGGHALYSELMRSHDRMGTRHLKKEQ